MPRTSSNARENEFRDTVLELVATRGYDRVTMDEVASKTSSSKSTLYRRWPSKAEFVVDALRHHASRALLAEPADTGNLRQDLIEMLTAVADGLTEDIDMALSLLAAARHDRVLMDTLRETLRSPRVELGRLPVQRAIARGELPADADSTLVDRITQPLMLHRASWNEGPLDAEYVTELVDDLILPLLHRDKSASPPSR